MPSDPLIQQLIRGHVWAIRPDALEALVEFARLRARGTIEIKALEDDDFEAPAPASRAQGDIGVLQIRGTIRQHSSGGFLDFLFGGTSTEFLARQFQTFMADEAVKAIVLDIDSPGGVAYGVTELANQIMDARGQKPIVAVANSVAASAAYWLGAAADHFFASPSALVGSIGAYMAHFDFSKMAENDGVKVTLVAAGKNKTRGNEFEALSDEDVAHFQGLVDDSYDAFVRDVARGRRVRLTEVRNGYGQGDVVTARQAMRLGMIDGIATVQEVVSRASSLRPRKVAAASAQVDGPPFVDHAEQVLASLQAFMERAFSLAELRAEEGRTLSEERREQIHAAVAEARAAIEQVEQTVAKPRDAEGHKVLGRLRWQALLAEAASLGVAVEV